jgi:hypothetical protein
MTSGGVFVHCTVEEGKLILDRILSVTPLEDMQFDVPLIFKGEPIITYLHTNKGRIASTHCTGNRLRK